MCPCGGKCIVLIPSTNFVMFCFKCMHGKIANTNQILETVELCMNRFGYNKFQIPKPCREKRTTSLNDWFLRRHSYFIYNTIYAYGIFKLCILLMYINTHGILFVLQLLIMQWFSKPIFFYYRLLTFLRKQAQFVSQHVNSNSATWSVWQSDWF